MGSISLQNTPEKNRKGTCYKKQTPPRAVRTRDNSNRIWGWKADEGSKKTLGPWQVLSDDSKWKWKGFKGRFRTSLGIELVTNKATFPQIPSLGKASANCLPQKFCCWSQIRMSPENLFQMEFLELIHTSESTTWRKGRRGGCTLLKQAHPEQ